MWWLIPATIFLVFIGLFFARWFIEIDSTKDLYRIRLEGIASGEITLNKDAIQIEIKIFWWKKIYDFETLLLSNTQENEAKPEIKKRKGGFKTKKTLQKVMNVIQSFKIRECNITLDTGNMTLNGILYPWFYVFSIRSKKTVMINFWGENTVVLQIENSLARMLWAFFKS